MNTSAEHLTMRPSNTEECAPTFARDFTNVLVCEWTKIYKDMIENACKEKNIVMNLEKYSVITHKDYNMAIAALASLPTIKRKEPTHPKLTAMHMYA